MALQAAMGPGGQLVPIVYLSGTRQNIAYNAAGGASAPSAAVGAKTEGIMISLTSADGDMRIAIGSAPVASSTTDLLVKPGVYFLGIAPGQKIAFLSNSATTGTVTFSELLGSG